MLSSNLVNRRSPLAPLLRAVAQIGRLRSLAIRVIIRLEGGQMRSPTFRELMLTHYGVEIGLYSYGTLLCLGGLPEGTRIGNYCSLAAGIAAFRRNHPISRIALHPFFYNADLKIVEDDTIHAVRDHPLTIDHDVRIGANAIITPRCKTIGLGAVVGAGAVVTKDVPPYAIVVGNPARRIGERFSAEIQQVLVECRWWEYPVDRLVPVLQLFKEDATLENARRLQQHLHSSNLTQ